MQQRRKTPLVSVDNVFLGRKVSFERKRKRGTECASENHLRAAHEEHCCSVHAEHPELRRNPQNIHDEKAHFNGSGPSK
jgi:hypothetical protein